MKRYYATLGGIRIEITAERAAQIRDLQKRIAKARKEIKTKQVNKK